MEPSEAENLDRPGLFVLNIEDRDPVARLGGEIVINARRGVDPRYPDAISPTEFKKSGDLFVTVREAFVGGKSMDDALLKAAKELGFTVTEAKVIGKAPEHWKRGE